MSQARPTEGKGVGGRLRPNLTPLPLPFSPHLPVAAAATASPLAPALTTSSSSSSSAESTRQEPSAMSSCWAVGP